MIWLAVGIALAVAEVFTTTFVLIMFALGALSAAAVAAADVGLVGQALVFAVVSVLALVLLRPVVRRHFARQTGGPPVGLQAMEGAVATVLEQVDADHGMVKIDGEMWRARPHDARQVIEVDALVRVVEVRGATLMVWRG